MNDGLGDAKVRSRDALIEANQPMPAVDVTNALHRRDGPIHPLIKLEPRLHEPNGVGGGTGHEPSAGSRTDMYNGSIRREEIVEDALGVGVCTKVDSPGGGTT